MGRGFCLQEALSSGANRHRNKGEAASEEESMLAGRTVSARAGRVNQVCAELLMLPPKMLAGTYLL